MRGSFVEAGYNVHEHDFTERSDEQLAQDMHETIQLRTIVGHVGERALQMDLREELIRREQMWRYEEAHPDTTLEEIEQAWAEYDGC